MKNIKRYPVESSQISSVGYDEGTKVLVVEFSRGALYAYKNVEKGTYNNFIDSDSPGKFFNQMIKNEYEFEKLKD
jgi:hypothetical protein